VKLDNNYVNKVIIIIIIIIIIIYQDLLLPLLQVSAKDLLPEISYLISYLRQGFLSSFILGKFYVLSSIVRLKTKTKDSE